MELRIHLSVDSFQDRVLVFQIVPARVSSLRRYPGFSRSVQASISIKGKSDAFHSYNQIVVIVMHDLIESGGIDWRGQISEIGKRVPEESQKASFHPPPQKIFFIQIIRLWFIYSDRIGTSHPGQNMELAGPGSWCLTHDVSHGDGMECRME